MGEDFDDGPLADQAVDADWPGWAGPGGPVSWLHIDADPDLATRLGPEATRPSVGFYATREKPDGAPGGSVGHLQFGYPPSPDNP